MSNSARKWAKGVPAVAALLLVLGCGGETPQRPNVLLLTVDTLRADHLSCYDYARRTSPEIDQLAEQSDYLETSTSDPCDCP